MSREQFIENDYPRQFLRHRHVDALCKPPACTRTISGLLTNMRYTNQMEALEGSDGVEI